MNHTLTAGDGTKTIYMKFRDCLTNTTTNITGTIILDTTAPTITITQPNTKLSYTTTEPKPIQKHKGSQAPNP
jgi:hypothetical protein